MEIQLPKQVSSFLIRTLENHDAAHDYWHAIAVLTNALAILERNGVVCTETERDMVMIACLFHDARDHKMEKCLSAEELLEFYTTIVGAENAKIIEHIHANCSWSKRHESEPAGDYEWLRLLVQDADWLEAIGQVGIERCIAYTTNKQPGLSPEGLVFEVKKHINEKLLLIYDEFNYAETRALAVATNRVQPLRDYLTI